MGCGKNCRWGKLLKEHAHFIDGIEAWASYEKHIIAQNAYRSVFISNIVDFVDSKEFRETDYNIAILGDVLEHLEYEAAKRLIDVLKEKVQYIFLIIPVTVCIQDGKAFGNPYETHVYHWSDKEIRSILGFQIIRFDTNPNHLVAIGAYWWRR